MALRPLGGSVWFWLSEVQSSFRKCNLDLCRFPTCFFVGVRVVLSVEWLSRSDCLHRHLGVLELTVSGAYCAGH